MKAARGAMLVFAAAAAAACSPEPRRAFPVGILGPVSPRVEAEARGMGLEIAEREPAGAAVVETALPGDGTNGEVTADRSRLRFLTAKAVLGAPSGVFFHLPGVPEGRDLMEYVEEFQAVDRALRELLAVRPILERGAPAIVPLSVPAGVEARAWTFRGRRYVLLVNPTAVPQGLRESELKSWRALFTVRSDARQDLASCGTDLCLPSEGTLWLEGRLLPGILP